MGYGQTECPVCRYDEADFQDVQIFGMCADCAANELERLRRKKKFWSLPVLGRVVDGGKVEWGKQP